MNLWAKSLKQLALWSVALFFFSCQDETTFIGLKNPNPKFEVFSVEIPLTSSVITVDSVYTDNTGSGTLLMGGYTDPVLGRVETKSFVHIWPTAAQLIATTSVFDSVTINLRYSYYSYGAATDRVESFKIHEISDAGFATASPMRATAASSLNYLPTPLASGSKAIDVEEFKEQFALARDNQDTLTVEKRLSDDFGKRIFDLAKEYDFGASSAPTVAAAQRADYFQQVNGLALVPDETTQGIVGIRNDAFSFVTLHYHSMENGAVKDTLSRNYVFSGASFSHISTDRSNSELSAVSRPYYPYLEDPAGLRYLQSGTPILTRVELANYYKFLEEDTVKDILINEVRFIVDGIQSTTATPPHSALALKLINRNGYFFNYAVAGERNELLLNNRAIYPSTTTDVNRNHFFINSDVSNSPAILGYQSAGNRYEGYITTFMQGLIRNRTLPTGEKNEKRIEYLALYPLNPPLPFSVTRTIFPADQVKLKIYFTRPISNSNSN